MKERTITHFPINVVLLTVGNFLDEIEKHFHLPFHIYNVNLILFRDVIYPLLNLVLENV